MKSIFLGDRLECYLVLKEFTIVNYVITSKNSRVDKFLYNSKKKITIRKNNLSKIFKLIKYGKEKLIVSAGFKKIIPNKFIPRNKIIINSHPSILPNYKGLKPVRDALKNKEKTIGVTTHYITKELDSGKIIKVKKFSIENKKNIYQIYKFIFSYLEPSNLRNTLKIFFN